LALGWLTLLGFHRHYLDFFHQTGGRSHDTFRTAEIEPKQAALREILGRRSPGETTMIVAGEYWNEKPLAYLAAREKGVRVESWSAVRDSTTLPQEAALQRVWFVEFSGSQAHREVREFLQAQGLAVGETQINDYAGRPVLSLIQAALREED
jgi:hypothetical protein